MEFSFEVNPDLDVAVGTEYVAEVIEVEDPSLEDESLQDDFDYSDYDPMTSTAAKPGSECKVKMLAARYAAGVPLWHDSDCYDHGPKDAIMDDEDLEEDAELELEEIA